MLRLPLDNAPARLCIANRTAVKAVEAWRRLRPHAGTTRIDLGCGFEALAGERFDLVINATSASLSGELPPPPPGLYAQGALAYDMMYGRATPFPARGACRRRGAVADGLGMLVEQAAESFVCGAACA